MQDFDRDLPADDHMLAEKHGTHAPFAQWLKDSVALLKDSSNESVKGIRVDHSSTMVSWIGWRSSRGQPLEAGGAASEVFWFLRGQDET